MLAVKEPVRLKKVKPEVVNLSSVEGNYLLYLFLVHICILVYAPVEAGEQGKGLGMISNGRKSRMYILEGQTKDTTSKLFSLHL